MSRTLKIWGVATQNAKKEPVLNLKFAVAFGFFGLKFALVFVSWVLTLKYGRLLDTYIRWWCISEFQFEIFQIKTTVGSLLEC